MKNLINKIIAYFAWSDWKLLESVNVYWDDEAIKNKQILNIRDVYVRYRLRDNKPEYKRINRW